MGVKVGSPRSSSQFLRFRSEPELGDLESGSLPGAGCRCGYGRAFAWWLSLLIGLLVCGCAGPRMKPYTILPGDVPETEVIQGAQSTLANLFPPAYRATQRAIITVRGKQFVCDGVLHVSPDSGLHLAVVSTLGLVTEIRVAPNGKVSLLKTTPLMKETWSSGFVARDLKILFLPNREHKTAARLSDGRLVLQAPSEADGTVTRFIFSSHGERLEEVEKVRQGRREYQARFRGFRDLPGAPLGTPAEFDVIAPTYRLYLRNTSFTRSFDSPSAP